MQQSIGSLIRQQRRAQNLTQSELGEGSFSKSYVSAVEKNKLTPSLAALKHFASRLGETDDYFVVLTQQTRREISLALQEMEESAQGVRPLPEKAALLDLLLEQTDSPHFQAPESFFLLSADFLGRLSLPQQAQYHFLRGRMLHSKTRYAEAIQACEVALAFANRPGLRAAILNELAACYLLAGLPQAALSYASRAHQIVAHETSLSAPSMLSFAVEMHCGKACLALSMYRNALEYFERARTALNAQQNMQEAGFLYWSLGYCTYALAFQQACSQNVEETENQFQRALSYLLQSCTLAQMSGDVREFRQRNMTLAMVQLDLAAWRRWSGRTGEASSAKKLAQVTLHSLLENTSELCRQVLLSFKGEWSLADSPVSEQKSTVSIALSLLIRATAQKALLAHEQGYESLFQREQSFATALCQRVLDASLDEALLETLLWSVDNKAEPFPAYSSPPLPHLPTPLPQEVEEDRFILLSQAEIYWAAGEVAEMLARTSQTPDFIDQCYTRAETCFLRALETLTRVGQHEDGGYLARAYQRYASLLEERTDKQQRTGQAISTLAACCKRGFVPPPVHPLVFTEPDPIYSERA